jgi:sulfate/thiosulfate transport system ATP-binding protein
MSIAFEQVTKRYQGQAVVNDVTLEIEPGEFFVLLGPSGSGKSTLLRALAGLIPIDHGRISLHGRDVTTVPARDRGVGFVFQHYALFRHMSVADNIEFALKVRKVKAAERRRRRAELLALVALEGLDDRLPSQLSGGQQQRVAVARALAHEPEVLLLDEPFGALDARIRAELRETIKHVQRRLGTTAILVTHDQEEAFALADRLGVMHMGRLLETGTPERLYRQPATRFVATFLGAANLFLARRTATGLLLGDALVAAPDSLAYQEDTRSEAVAVVRPEDLELGDVASRRKSKSLAEGLVLSAGFAGSAERVLVQLPPDTSLVSAVATQTDDAAPLVVEVLRTAAERAALPLTIGRRVALGLRRVHTLPTPISSFALAPHDPSALDSLRNSALLAQLARSMQARVLEPSEAPQGGVTVVEGSAPALPHIARLVANGASRILCLPPKSALPRRVFVLANAESARASTLALTASVLRHLAAEATYITLQMPAAPRAEVTAAFRRLLDARSELHAGHGLDLRTEVHIGDIEGWVMALAADREPALVVLGIEGSGDELADTLQRQFLPLFAAESRCPVLVVSNPRPPYATGLSEPPAASSEAVTIVPAPDRSASP